MPVCIAGMGRSGTSLCAHLLHRCGLFLGPEDDRVAADDGEAGGDTTNTRFLALNDALLHAAGAAWDCPPALADQWPTDERFVPLKAAAHELLRTFNDRAPWGWSDPRNSLTLPFWLDLIPDLQVVVCVRNPLEVVRSLSERYGCSYALGMRLWYQYNHAILATVPPERRIVTHHDRYFTTPGPELRRLLAALDLHASARKIAQACATIALNPCTRQYTTASLIAAGAASEVTALYQALRAEAGVVASPQTDAHDSAASVAWFTSPRPAQARAIFPPQPTEAGEEQDDVRAHLTAVERDRATLRHDLHGVEQERDALRDYLLGIEEERSALRNYADELEHERGALRDYARTLEDERAAFRTYLTELERERIAVRTRMEESERDRAAVRDYLEQIVVERDALRAYLSDLEREREAFRAYLSDIEGDRAAQYDLLAEYQRGNEALIQTNADSRAEIERLIEEGSRHIAALTTVIADRDGELDALRQEISTLHATIARHNARPLIRLSRRLRAATELDVHA